MTTPTTGTTGVRPERLADGGVRMSTKAVAPAAQMTSKGRRAIGLELGSVWARLGAKVTVVEMLPSIAPFADTQMSGALQRALTAQGLEFHLESRVTGIASLENGAEVSFEDNFDAELSAELGDLGPSQERKSSGNGGGGNRRGGRRRHR